jgi:hypothetical protein
MTVVADAGPLIALGVKLILSPAHPRRELEKTTGAA